MYADYERDEPLLSAGQGKKCSGKKSSRRSDSQVERNIGEVVSRRPAVVYGSVETVHCRNHRPIKARFPEAREQCGIDLWQRYNRAPALDISVVKPDKTVGEVARVDEKSDSEHCEKKYARREALPRNRYMAMKR